MNLKETIRGFLEILFSKSLWIPIFFFLSILSSLLLAFMFGLVGLFVPYIWIFVLFAHRVLREFLIGLFPSHGWEIPTERSDKALSDIEKEFRKTKPCPP